jgi:dolichyl-phosphate-mannose-protein mannosyltransferase
LLLAGIALHFFRLGQPGTVVFDEVHFGRFADAYCCAGAYIFDVHPPHGKLLAALGLKLGGYEGGQSFETIGTSLSEVRPWLLRLVPALAGSLIPLVVFTLLIQLGASSWAAFLGGWAVLFDNALLLQTRVLALDGIMIFFMLAAISLALLAVRQAMLKGQLLSSVGAGLCVGMAVGSKFTGLTSAALVGVVLLVGTGQPGFVRRVGLIASAFLGALAVYLGGWVLHFLLLDQPGPGDIWGTPSEVLWRDIVEIHRKMFAANFGLGAGHPNASSWWGWPFMWRPVYYFAEGDRAIYLLGNPVVWWGSSIGLVLILWNIFRGSWEDFRANGAHCAPYLISFVPYFFIPRVLFLYHYLPSLVFAVMAVVLWLDRSGRQGTFPWLLAAIPVGFAVVSPFTFGLPLPESILVWMRDLVH